MSRFPAGQETRRPARERQGTETHVARFGKKLIWCEFSICRNPSLAFLWNNVGRRSSNAFRLVATGHAPALTGLGFPDTLPMRCSPQMLAGTTPLPLVWPVERLSNGCQRLRFVLAFLVLSEAWKRIQCSLLARKAFPVSAVCSKNWNSGLHRNHIEGRFFHHLQLH